MNNIAVLGPKGTFSDCASKKYIDIIHTKMNQLYYPTISDVYQAVGTECNYGIVPVENTLDGYVQKSLDLLLERNLRIITEITIPVRFSLVSNTKDTDGIKTLYVQFIANGQCRECIEKLTGVKIVTTESNMESFDNVMKGIDGEAAIIPQHMFELAGSGFGNEDVTDSDNNFTRFLIVEPWSSTNHIEPDRKIKIALYILPDVDRPGILFEILENFSSNKINLVSIISRPTKKNMGTYNFYIELSAAYDERNLVIDTLNKIKCNYNMKLLGFYSI